ncbi:MAG: hypothetical protein M1459_00410 [Patescibacteria group bacterium]|nr:hypothetical protein [Patescibacteria group bacterium]
MKRVIILLLIAVLFGSANFAQAATHVRGYFRKNGTYVMPYYRSDKNYIKFDNWSYHGNINPFTSKRGYKW